MRKIGKYSTIKGMLPCRKKPIQVLAKKMDENFIVETLEGKLCGKKGDYLICGVEGEYYPCKAAIFHKTYEWDDQNES